MAEVEEGSGRGRREVGDVEDEGGRSRLDVAEEGWVLSGRQVCGFEGRRLRSKEGGWGGVGCCAPKLGRHAVAAQPGLLEGALCPPQPPRRKGVCSKC